MKASKHVTKRTTALAVLLLFVVIAAPAAAQRGKWWQNDRVQRELGLTVEQSTRLEEIFQKSQPILRQQMEKLKQAEVAFDKVVETGDDAEVMRQADVVEAARAEMNKARTMMLLRMRRSLTADQWAKFTAIATVQRDRDRARPPDRER